MSTFEDYEQAVLLQPFRVEEDGIALASMGLMTAAEDAVSAAHGESPLDVPRDELIECLGFALWYIAYLAHSVGSDLSEVAAANAATITAPSATTA